jgi:hypothetical protein
MLLLFTNCDFKNLCDFIPLRFDLRVEVPERDNSTLVPQPTTVLLLPIIIQRSFGIIPLHKNFLEWTLPECDNSMECCPAPL